MLIVRVQVNGNLLDEIFIRRIECDQDGVCTYKIEGHEGLGVIRHKYSDGYMPLLQKALEVLHVSYEGAFCSDDDGDRFPIRARSNGVSDTSKASWAYEILAAARDSGLC